MLQKGTEDPGRQRAESLSLFVPYNFTWRGKNDLKTLVNAETCEINLL